MKLILLILLTVLSAASYAYTAAWKKGDKVPLIDYVASGGVTVSINNERVSETSEVMGHGRIGDLIHLRFKLPRFSVSAELAGSYLGVSQRCYTDDGDPVRGWGFHYVALNDENFVEGEYRTWTVMQERNDMSASIYAPFGFDDVLRSYRCVIIAQSPDGKRELRVDTRAGSTTNREFRLTLDKVNIPLTASGTGDWGTWVKLTAPPLDGGEIEVVVNSNNGDTFEIDGENVTHIPLVRDGDPEYVYFTHLYLSGKVNKPGRSVYNVTFNVTLQ
ncbi:TPA: hypothetical protein JLD44_004801 [Escherichia coli]|nr:hypothetical protein [Escherichia coli]HAW3384597.1 hypothetical protein [Escherichia coli]